MNKMMLAPNALSISIPLSHLEFSHDLAEQSRKVQPISFAKLGFDHKRYLVFICGIVAVAGIEKLSGRAVRRPEHPDVHAEETIAHVEGTLQLTVASWC